MDVILTFLYMVIIVQRYFAKSKNSNYFKLDDGDIHHIINVMRMKNNDYIEVVYDGILYKCRVLINEKVDVVFDSIMESNLNDLIEFILIIPVLKEQKMDLVLQKATELGVSRIIPITTERTIVKVNDKEDKKIARWSRILKEASEQSKRVNVPIIDNVKSINQLRFSDGVRIVCSTKENKKNIKNLMHNLKECDKMYIVVGPEGGLSISEEEKLNELGFVSVSLGSRIMRVETVPLYILSILNYEFME